MQRDGGPGGAGGAGNPVGGSFTGPAQALEITGDFGYAYSGAINLDNETKTFLEFRTGNFIYNSVTQLTGIYANMAGGKQLRLIISMNGAVVLNHSPSTSSALAPFDYDAFYLIMPPYTEVKVEVLTTDTGQLDFFVTMTGRIYRG